MGEFYFETFVTTYKKAEAINKVGLLKKLLASSILIL